MPHRRFNAPQRDGLGESETAARQQRRILVRRDIPLHDEDTRTGRRRAPAVHEDGNRLIVVKGGRKSL